MLHDRIFDTFTKMFPNIAERIVKWLPNGKNSVRLRDSYGRDFVFTFNSEKEWRFETVKSFIDTIR